MHWQLQNTNLHVIGSVHISARQLTIKPAIAKLLEDAEVIAFEANFDLEPDAQMGLYPSSTSLSKNIPPDLLVDTQRMWAETNRPTAELDHYRPWHAAFLLMNAALHSRGFSPANGIDQQVIELAKRTRKTLFFLETREAGIEPFRGAPHEEQLRFLSDVVRNIEEGIQDATSIGESWENNDPNGLHTIWDKCIRLMPRSYAGALGGRNRQWLPKLLKLARGRKRAVAVVGALHMIGPEGLPTMFKAAGINCRHITTDSHSGSGA